MAENYFGLTDTGRVRTNNEDAFIAERIYNNRIILACVIDGVGGYSGGEVAAAIARETILEIFSKDTPDLQGQMQMALTMANDRIAEAKQKNKENESMACVLTLALIDIENNQFHYAHVGDTRLYLFRDASLVKLSKDHSFVGFLEDTGRLSEDAAMQHPKRNEINKALGFGGIMKAGEEYIEMGESPFLPGDLLLLCSDGLTDMINKADITTLLSAQNSLEEKGTNLVAAANDKGGKDNITVALVYHDKAPLKQKATKPPALKKNEIPKADVIPTPAAQSSVVSKKRMGNNKTVLFLSLLSLILLATLSWALWKLYNNGDKDPVLVMNTAIPRNAEEQKLQQLINHSLSDTLILSDSVFTREIKLSDTIFIDRPFLYLRGSGNLLITADPSYKGPAFFVSESNKKLVMDSLLFENFDVAIAASHKQVVLQNIRFNQCRVAVATNTSFPDILYVNGVLTDTSFSTDSIPKPRR